MTDLSYYFAFNAEGNVEDEIALTYSIQNRIRQTSIVDILRGWKKQGVLLLIIWWIVFPWNLPGSVIHYGNCADYLL